MFEKVPFGFKVRIRGSEDTGYYVQYCIDYNRFIPFLNYWSVSGKVFITLEDAKKHAMREYNDWISYLERSEAARKARKAVKKTVVWEYP